MKTVAVIQKKAKKNKEEVDWDHVDNIMQGIKDIAKGKIKRIL